MQGRLSASVVAISAALTLASCAKSVGDGASHLAQKTGDSVGCTSFTDDFYDELYSFPLAKKEFPDRATVDQALEKSFREGRLQPVPEADRARLREAIGEVYDLLAQDVTAIAQARHEDAVQTLSAIELGDRTTAEKAALQEKIHAKFTEISALTDGLKTAGLLTACAPVPAAPAPESTPKPGTLFEQWKSSRHPAVYGGLKTLATAYQSCTAAVVPPVDAQTPDVDGISIVGTHEDGIGSKRLVTDLPALLKSHVYLKNYTKPKILGCFDVRSSPLIYDYGGRPVVSDTTTSTFDLFKDAGSGTTALGIDCSAYVYVSMATAGLKLKADGRLKAIGVRGITSYMFLDPAGNGLSCLQHATFGKTSNLKPGDVIAKPGHVFLVEKVGADPFGIDGIKTSADCRLENMSLDRFDFTILQSSNAKNGIGIHRAKASDFLKETSMGDGLKLHAVNACKAKFGLTTSSRVTDLSIVRHLGSEACRDTSLALERESCVSSCKAPATRSL